jgi:hypothetical protein
MKRFLPLSLCALAILSMCGAAFGQTAAKKTIAVIDFETRGAVSRDEAGTLTDRLRSYLVNTGEFNVVERGQMESLLQEQGFQQTGCTSTECAVEVGKLLNVQEIVAGAVGKIGAKYTLDVRCLSVETGKIQSSIVQEYSGNSEGLLDVIELIAHQLAGNVDGLSVSTTPVPTAVFVNNKPIGTSPLKSLRRIAGEHTIRFVAKGYKPVDYNLKIEKGKAKKLNARLKKKSGKTMLYVSGPVVVLGGIALVWRPWEKPEDVPFPEPPDRPSR